MSGGVGQGGVGQRRGGRLAGWVCAGWPAEPDLEGRPSQRRAAGRGSCCWAAERGALPVQNHGPDPCARLPLASPCAAWARPMANTSGRCSTVSGARRCHGEQGRSPRLGAAHSRRPGSAAAAHARSAPPPPAHPPTHRPLSPVGITCGSDLPSRPPRRSPAVPQGRGASDFFDALAVAAARLAAAELTTVDKRVVMISNFCSRVGGLGAGGGVQAVAGLAAAPRPRAHPSFTCACVDSLPA